MGLMSGIGSLIGGEKANEAAGADRLAAMQAQKDALNRILALHPELAQYTSAGQLDPMLEQAIAQGPTELSHVNVDQNNLDAQKAALGSLQQRGQGQMSAQDQAALNQILSQVAQQNQGQRGAIQQNFAQRGMSGSGMNLAAQLQAQQAAATNASEQATRLAAQRQALSQQSLLNAGQLGGQMAQQDYQRKAAAAQAQDLINQMNTRNQQQVQGYNVGTQNDAQARNLAAKQAIQNMNEKAKQDLYNHQYQQATAASGVGNNLAAAYNNQANQKAAQEYNRYAGIGNIMDSPEGLFTGNDSTFGKSAKSSGTQSNSVGQSRNDTADLSGYAASDNGNMAGQGDNEEEKKKSGMNFGSMMSMIA